MNLFEAIFKNDRNATAIHYRQREISYGELEARTLAMATAISALGVTRGDRVAILLPDSPEFVEIFIATCSLGAIAVPINMALKTDDQCAILHNSEARFAFIEQYLCNTVLTGASEKLRYLEKIVQVDLKPQVQNDGASDSFSITTWKANGTSQTFQPLDQLLFESRGNERPNLHEPGESEPAFLLYTSGSTGEPKGAIHRQSDIFYINQTFCRQVLQLKSTDRLFSSSRLPFAYGLGNAFSFPLLNVASTVLYADKPTPDAIDLIFDFYQPTIFFAVPVVYNLLLDHHQTSNKLNCSSLRLCISAGEALPAHLGEAWEEEFGVPVLDGIGSTEMCHMFFSNVQGQVKYGSSGKLVEGYEARLLDDSGQIIETADEGNLWIKGDSAAIGYWNKPEQTANTFVDGWVRTGDLYRRDAEGYWFHMGRSDDCFKSSGQWVSPVQVEGVLLRHEQISSAAVVEDFDAEGLPCPCAFVVSKNVESDKVEFERELRELAKSLPKFKQPRRYVFLNELPYTATGKIQRFKLRQQLRQDSKLS